MFSDPVIRMCEDHKKFMNEVSQTLHEINVILSNIIKVRKETQTPSVQEKSISTKVESPFEESVRLEKEELNFRHKYETDILKTRKMSYPDRRALSKAAWEQKLSRLSLV